MTFIGRFLSLTNFKGPFLRTLVPSTCVVFAIQAGFAIPAIINQTDRFYDFSGSLTYLSVTALSLYLPAIRTNYIAGSGLNTSLSGLSKIGARAAESGGFNWRQLALSFAVGLWAVRLGSYLFQRVLQQGHDSRFDEIKKSPAKFFAAFMAQATWVSICAMPVVAVNSIPVSVLAKLPIVKLSDALGLSLFAGGLILEATADWQKSKWMREKRAKLHDEEFMTRGLWSRSQYPNYFGESMLWTGIATVSAGVLLTRPVQMALGLGPVAAVLLPYASPAFVTFLLLKISGVPLSREKYDKRFGDRKDYQEWKKQTPVFIPKLF